jgi:hypothetical protein
MSSVPTAAHIVPPIHQIDPLIEIINLRRVRAGFGIASIRLPHCHLRNIAVSVLPCGRLKIRPPKVLSRNGRTDYGAAFALEPYMQQAVEAAISALWARLVDADNDAAAELERA